MNSLRDFHIKIELRKKKEQLPFLLNLLTVYILVK